MCARVNTADDPSTSDKDLVNVGLVTPDFSGAFAQGRGLHARLSHTFLV